MILETAHRTLNVKFTPTHSRPNYPEPAIRFEWNGGKLKADYYVSTLKACIAKNGWVYVMDGVILSPFQMKNILDHFGL